MKRILEGLLYWSCAVVLAAYGAGLIKPGPGEVDLPS